MIGSIIWLVILVIIVVRISDRKKGIRRTSPATRQRQQSGAQQQSEHRQTDRQWESGGHVSQEELKRRLQEKYGTRKPKTSESVKPNTNTVSAERNNVSASVSSKGNIRTEKTETYPVASRGSTRTGKTEMYPAASLGNTGYQKSDILNRASQNVEETEDDMLQMPKENDLMKMVNDIMAKGVDTSIPFERDFIAEGMDIVNRITL